MKKQTTNHQLRVQTQARAGKVCEMLLPEGHTCKMDCTKAYVTGKISAPYVCYQKCTNEFSALTECPPVLPPGDMPWRV